MVIHLKVKQIPKFWLILLSTIIKANVNAEMAVRLALSKVIGAYGIVVSCTKEQDQLIAARKGSPLVIGIGKDEYFIASDATPIVEHTKSVIYLNNDNVAIIKRNELVIKTIDDVELTPDIHELQLDLGEIEKNGFDHFMMKEIFEQPRSIKDTFRGRLIFRS
jgi:glutamine---fructose-6-phosphate transaminase (isomerizing)